MKIFLFDMDGVLLESQGYHQALQETIRRVALALGFGDVTMSEEVIATFEAGGITSEWDEAAIVTAALLEVAWQDDPSLRLPDSLAHPAPITSAQPRSFPNLLKLARTVTSTDMLPLHPLERAASLFFHRGGRTEAQEQYLHEVILGARSSDLSLTHCTFQELVLGSDEFSRAYNLPADLHCESYLLKYDVSNLTESAGTLLREWLAYPGNAAAIITSRPSIPPAGVFSTPEAELGTRLVRLEGFPILGWGGMCWLALQTHTDPQSFLKPSPVHALAGIRMALGEPQQLALPEAADLVKNGLGTGAWEKLEGVEITIFEDTPTGIRSLQAAQSVLSKMRVHVTITCCGIARQPIKINSLRSSSAEVFASLPEALEAACR